MKKNITKIICLALTLLVFRIFGLFVSPLIENSLAINQMSYSFESNLLIQVYDYISNYSWVIYLLLVILVFRKEILNILKKLKERKGETNEQI